MLRLLRRPSRALAELPVIEPEGDPRPLPPGALFDLAEGWPRPRRRRLARLIVDEYMHGTRVVPWEDWPPEIAEQFVDSWAVRQLDEILEACKADVIFPVEVRER